MFVNFVYVSMRLTLEFIKGQVTNLALATYIGDIVFLIYFFIYFIYFILFIYFHCLIFKKEGNSVFFPEIKAHADISCEFRNVIQTSKSFENFSSITYIPQSSHSETVIMSAITAYH